MTGFEWLSIGNTGLLADGRNWQEMLVPLIAMVLFGLNGLLKARKAQTQKKPAPPRVPETGGQQQRPAPRSSQRPLPSYARKVHQKQSPTTSTGAPRPPQEVYQRPVQKPSQPIPQSRQVAKPTASRTQVPQPRPAAKPVPQQAVYTKPRKKISQPQKMTAFQAAHMQAGKTPSAPAQRQTAPQRRIQAGLTKQKKKAPLPAETGIQTKPPQGLAPFLGESNDWVRGIVLSEVLGTPVALREQSERAVF